MPASLRADPALPPYVSQVRNDNMMPNQLLSTFHADNDYHIKDTYNFVTVRVSHRLSHPHPDTPAAAPLDGSSEILHGMGAANTPHNSIPCLEHIHQADRMTAHRLSPQTDVMKPIEHVEYLHDEYRQGRMKSAIQMAVQAISDEDKDCRVLHLGAGKNLDTHF